MGRKKKPPKLYKKSQDGAYYFNYEGKQKYAGKTLEKAQAKLREVTGLAPSGDTDLVALVGQYLDSLVGSQSPDTIYGKAGTYKRMLAYLSGQRINGDGGPGLYSLHDSSKAKAKHRSYVEAMSTLLEEPIPLSALTTEALEKYQRALLRKGKKAPEMAPRVFVSFSSLAVQEAQRRADVEGRTLHKISEEEVPFRVHDALLEPEYLEWLQRERGLECHPEKRHKYWHKVAVYRVE